MDSSENTALLKIDMEAADVLKGIVIAIGVLAKCDIQQINNIDIHIVKNHANFTQECVYIYRGKEGYTTIGHMAIEEGAMIMTQHELISKMAATLALIKDK